MAPDLRSIYAQAVRHHQAGRLDEAVAGYDGVLALRPDLAAAHHNLGNALFEQGKLEEAEASYRRAVVLQPDLASARNNLGTILLQQDKLDEAIACYRQALALQPDYPEALSNLGAALCRRGALDEGEASIRRALALKPGFAGAHDNLGSLLWEQGKLEEAEASARRALALAPGFARALIHLGSILNDSGRLDEALAAYRQLLQLEPRNAAGLNGLACVLAAQGQTAEALETILGSLRIEQTADTKRIFVGIVKDFSWKQDEPEARQIMVRALTEPWARPGALSRTAARLVKQGRHTGAAVTAAARAWPSYLSASELFGPKGPAAFAGDALLLALLVSAQNTDIELERFLTMARRTLLEAAASGAPANGETLEFYAALARQCFINEYVFCHSEEEIGGAHAQRAGLAASLGAGEPVSALRLLAVAAYFPLDALPGAERLLDQAWPKPLSALLMQQVREPQEEAALRAAIPRMTPVKDATSRLVREQYEENPYPRWVRMPPVAKTDTIAAYLRRKFPAAVLPNDGAVEVADFLSAGCGTGQLALETVQRMKGRILAIDLSLASLGYAARKASELGLDGIEFAQADLLELAATGRSFDVIECSGVLHHLADPFAGWRALLSLLRPGGFMLVGLYSEMARRGIARARRFIAEQGYGPSADDIRRCRQELLKLDQGSALGAAFGDFFGTSSCRDLLFHVQEQQMQLPGIAAFLEDSGAAFLGFEMDDATLRAYRRQFPGDPQATNLDHWHAFEQDNPDTFSSMYVFWIQKRGDAV